MKHSVDIVNELSRRDEVVPAMLTATTAEATVEAGQAMGGAVRPSEAGGAGTENGEDSRMRNENV
jgi:hypothetical protein